MIRSDVVGVGSAIVDLTVEVEESVIDSLGLTKGTMQLVDRETIDELEAGLITPPTMSGGGSVANTMVGLAGTGREVAMITPIADDRYGAFFVDEIAALDVIAVVPERDFEHRTGRCLVFVTPDGERTMCTYLGASAEVTADDIPATLYIGSRYLYLEGYLLDIDGLTQGLSQLGAVARRYGVQVALSLSDTSVVQRHRDQLARLLSTSVDIVFANAEEGAALTGRDDPREVVAALQRFGCAGALTLGSYGAIGFDHSEFVYQEARPVSLIVDTTGAGDQFAAGYLAGSCRSLDIETCLTLGQVAAVEVIGHLGGRPLTPLGELIADVDPELERILSR
ncbi:MAG: adenosine kinase [Ferrimicrobium sp.]